MKGGKKMDSTLLRLITAINSLEMSGNAPHTVEVLKKIYEEMYGIPVKKVS